MGMQTGGLTSPQSSIHTDERTGSQNDGYASESGVTAGGLAYEMSEKRVDIWTGQRVSECAVMLQMIGQLTFAL